jgi:hypothetical protein
MALPRRRPTSTTRVFERNEATGSLSLVGAADPAISLALTPQIPAPATDETYAKARTIISPAQAPQTRAGVSAHVLARFVPRRGKRRRALVIVIPRRGEDAKPFMQNEPMQFLYPL